MPQALDLWSDLEAAYYGKSRFGGDTAEIYIYRLMPFSPSVVALWDKPGALDGSTMTAQWARGEYDLANEALHDLLRHFAKKKDVRIEVEGQELGPWLKTARHTHRVHVRVISEKPR